MTCRMRLSFFKRHYIHAHELQAKFEIVIYLQGVIRIACEMHVNNSVVITMQFTTYFITDLQHQNK